MVAQTMQGAPAPAPRYPRITNILHSNTYNIFILVLTIVSLTIMVIQLLAVPDTETWKLVSFYDNLICVIFLIDFALHMMEVPRKRDYFIGQRGYLDLLGSIPTLGLGVFRYAGLLRLFRLSRLFRLRRLMNPQNRALLQKEILDNRGSYALFITLMLVAFVLMFASIFVLAFESQSPDANILNGGNAVWWAVVTITTVGYGDRYPVTAGGRWVAVFVMFSGVGIIGALASILASILVPQPRDKEEPEPAPATDPGIPVAAPSTTIAQELVAVKSELAAIRQLLEKRDT